MEAARNQISWSIVECFCQSTPAQKRSTATDNMQNKKKRAMKWRLENIEQPNFFFIIDGSKKLVHVSNLSQMSNVAQTTTPTMTTVKTT